MAKSSPFYDVLLPTAGLRIAFEAVRGLDGEGIRLLEGVPLGPSGSKLYSAAGMFGLVQTKGREIEIDRLCLPRVLRAAAAIRAGRTISVNVFAQTLDNDPTLPEQVCWLAETNSLPASELIVEIVEHSARAIGSGLPRAVAVLRDRGLRLAIDDVTSSRVLTGPILACRPDFLKLHQGLVRECRTDASRRATVASIVRIARELRAEVIAQGVETQDDADTLRDLGVSGAQRDSD